MTMRFEGSVWLDAIVRERETDEREIDLLDFDSYGHPATSNNGTHFSVHFSTTDLINSIDDLQERLDKEGYIKFKIRLEEEIESK